MSAAVSALKQLMTEMRRRRVFRRTAIYIVAAWVLVQVASEAFPALSIPEGASRYIWVVSIFGFPLAVLFSWRYDVTAEGIRRTPNALGDAATELPLTRVDYGVLATLALLVGIAVFSAGQRLVEVRTVITTAPATRQIDPNSIAVLPLASLSPKPDDAYFAAGVHDALITSLSKISALMVTSRKSTLNVSPQLSVPEIGRQLGVAKLLEGSVLMDGDDVRVIVQLVDAASDSNVWAETFDRDLTDIVALQNEIARTIADVVEVRLAPREEAALSRADAVDPDIYRDYLKGMYQFFQDTPEADWRGVEIMKDVVHRDPTSALAYAGLAYGYANIAHSPSSLVQFPDLPDKARTAAETALQLDPERAEAHMAMGMYLTMFEWDFEGAEQALKRAIELNPSLALAHYDLAWVYELMGPEWEERSLAHGDRTRELNPLSPFMLGGLAWQYMDACQYDEALSLAREAIRLNPEHPMGWLSLGLTYAELGRFDEAIDAHKRLEGTVWAWLVGITYATAGLEEKAREVAAAWEVNPLAPAWIYARLGDREASLPWLDEAEKARVPWYPWMLGNFPGSATIADDPGVQARAAALGLR
jgi:TolB-like protein/Tfp pilus assembly protein PilF